MKDIKKDNKLYHLNAETHSGASQELREAHMEWEDNVAISAFEQWAENKLTQDGAWDDFFTENNTKWETEPDGEPNLVFSGNFSALVDGLIAEFEKEHGRMSDEAIKSAGDKMERRLQDAWEQNSEWENQPDHLGEAINKAFDDFSDASYENIDTLNEWRHEYNEEIKRSIR